MAIKQVAVGGVVDAGDVNQYGDVPATIASASTTTSQTIATSATYAVLPTAPVSASLVTTHASTLVQVVVTGEWGNGSTGALSAIGLLSFALSGTVTLAASDAVALAGGAPGVFGGSLVYWVIAPAGTLTATLQARGAPSTTLRSASVQLVAVRPL